MKNRNRIVLASLSVFLLAANGVAAAASRQANPAAPAPVAVVPFTSYDFGEVFKGEVISHLFRFRNSGKADLIIKDFTAD
ncbi:MAG TPA: hypothetical protein VJH03_24930 [Blastocatellia bacterium]|nr:hypothetical protein [Blastocatellia bacterium]